MYIKLEKNSGLPTLKDYILNKEYLKLIDFILDETSITPVLDTIIKEESDEMGEEDVALRDRLDWLSQYLDTLSSREWGHETYSHIKASLTQEDDSQRAEIFRLLLALIADIKVLKDEDEEIEKVPNIEWHDEPHSVEGFIICLRTALRLGSVNLFAGLIRTIKVNNKFGIVLDTFLCHEDLSEHRLDKMLFELEPAISDGELEYESKWTKQINADEIKVKNFELLLDNEETQPWAIELLGTEPVGTALTSRLLEPGAFPPSFIPIAYLEVLLKMVKCLQLDILRESRGERLLTGRKWFDNVLFYLTYSNSLNNPDDPERAIELGCLICLWGIMHPQVSLFETYTLRHYFGLVSHQEVNRTYLCMELMDVSPAFRPTMLTFMGSPDFLDMFYNAPQMAEKLFEFAYFNITSLVLDHIAALPTETEEYISYLENKPDIDEDGANKLQDLRNLKAYLDIYLIAQNFLDYYALMACFAFENPNPVYDFGSTHDDVGGSNVAGTSARAFVPPVPPKDTGGGLGDRETSASSATNSTSMTTFN